MFAMMLSWKKDTFIWEPGMSNSCKCVFNNTLKKLCLKTNVDMFE